MRLLALLTVVVAACGSDPTSNDTTAVDALPTDVTVADTTVADVAPEIVDQTVCSAGGPITLACIDETNLHTTMDAIVGPRTLADAKHQTASELCKSTFTALGFTVSELPAAQGTNVIGTRTGTTKPSELVVVGAHFDGVPGCDAADDNGSGVAGLLEVARVLRAREHERTLVVACWDTEELGLIGSDAHAATLAATHADVAMAYVFEMIGFTSSEPNSQKFPTGFDLIFPDAAAKLAANEYRGDFITVVIGDDAPGPNAAMGAAASAIGLPQIPITLNQGLRSSDLLADLRRSDHASFWSRGYPAAMITDTANFRNPHYHCGDGADALATLDFGFMRQVAAMTASAAEQTLDAPDRGTTTPP